MILLCLSIVFSCLSTSEGQKVNDQASSINRIKIETFEQDIMLKIDDDKQKLLLLSAYSKDRDSGYYLLDQETAEKDRITIKNLIDTCLNETNKGQQTTLVEKDKAGSQSVLVSPSPASETKELSLADSKERGVTRSSSARYSHSPPRRRRPPLSREQELSQDQKVLVESAFGLLGRRPNSTVYVGNKRFKLDCIGTVAAIFENLHIDIMKDSHKYTARGAGYGVSSVYASLDDKEALKRIKLPKVGDIIFWSHTWDRNRDGIWGNDPNTHAGIVVHVEDDGTVHYVHEHVSLGVVVERMNPWHPKERKSPIGKTWNDAMASGSYQGNPHNPERWLSGDLWNAYGGVLTVKEKYM